MKRLGSVVAVVALLLNAMVAVAHVARAMPLDPTAICHAASPGKRPPLEKQTGACPLCLHAAHAVLLPAGEPPGPAAPVRTGIVVFPSAPAAACPSTAAQPNARGPPAA